MKLLHLTNYYPPYAVGTPERQCRLIVNELAHRGHFNRVLTSDYTIPTLPDRERFAKRDLRIARQGKRTGKFGSLLRAERHNLITLAAELDEIHTDVVVIWSLTGISNSMIWEIERRGIHMLFAVLDPWLRDRLRGDPWYRWWTAALPLPQRALRRFLRTTALDRLVLHRYPVHRPIDLPLRHAFFASRALRESVRSAGFHMGQTEVIPHCIGREEIPGQPQRRDDLRRLLWIGRLESERDPMTAIQAVQELRHIGQLQFTLDMFGRGDVAFESRIHDYVRDAQLGGAVNIRRAEVEEMIALFPTYDVFLFTARQPEPFPLLILRAMASRLPVVSTLEGSCTDLLQGGQNCVLFRTGDPVDCANKIRSLTDDRELVDALTERAFRDVLDTYSATIVTGSVEKMLTAVVRDRTLRTR